MAETAEKIADDAPNEENTDVPAPVNEDIVSVDDDVTSSVDDDVISSVDDDAASAPGQTEEAAEPVQESLTDQILDRESRNSLTCTAKLLDKYTIDGAMPLPQFDSPTARAYDVTDHTMPDMKLFALMCQPGMPVRIGTIRKLMSIRARGHLPIVDWGYVYWEPADQMVAAIVFEQPLGGSLTDAVASGVTRINEYDITKRVIMPAVQGIASLDEAGLVHRAIRPDNLYFMNEERTEIVLGECVTTPPGYDQPAMYESAGRSVTPPSGRGHGTMADDIYALGISIVMILLGYNPLRKHSTLDILAAKVEKGTYAAICGNARLPISMIDLLRGLMSDDTKARWGLEQIEVWAAGHRQAPLQRTGQPKASSPYIFKKRGYFSPQTLAYAFASDYEEAYRVLKSDENFEIWLRRSLENEDMAKIYKVLMDRAGSMATKPDIVMSKVCTLLDPMGPIHYRGYALMPDALGAAIAVEMIVENNPEPIADIIRKEVFEFWFMAQGELTQEQSKQQRTFNRCRSHLKMPDIGYGIERVLYELNGFMPCQSKLVLQENIWDCNDLLVVLDKISSKIEANTRPIDRHIAAFIAARFTEGIQLHLKTISSPSIERSAIGVLSLFAFLQRRLAPGPLLGLTSWVGGQVGPAINTYHSRTTRRELEREIPQVVRKGSLPELFELIENSEKRRNDASGFREAQNTFLAAENEIIDIVGVEGERDKKLLQAGQKATALISILLSMCIVTTLFILGVF